MRKLDPSHIIFPPPRNFQSKDMDAKNIQLDLYALKRLYGLLEKDRNGTSNADLLDEHARLMLKNLLDEATKKVLKLHSEIISGQVEASATQHSPSLLHQPYEPKPLIAAQANQQSYGEDRKNVNGLLDGTLWGDTSFSGPQTMKKRCRLCLKNTVKKHLQPTDDDDDKDTIFFDVAQNLNNEEEIDCLSKEASEAIKNIELCISAFDIGADHLHLFEDNNSNNSYYSQIRNRNFDMCQFDESFMNGNNFLSEFPNQRFVDPIVTNQPYLLLGQTFKIVPPTAKPMFRQPTNNFIVENQAYDASTMVAGGNNPSKKTPQKDEIPANRNRKIPARAFIQNQESESTSNESYSNSTYSDNSKEYSSSADKNYVTTTSSTSSEVGGLLTSHGSDTTSNTDEDEAYSYTSSESPPREATSSSSSSENEGYSPKQSSYKKQIGMWRSLKDRLAIIFHHHHHHHHHDYGKDRKKMSRNKSLFKGRVDSLKREHEVYGEKAVEKMSKSLVREKNGQKNNFHGLMGGVLKHVRKSKKQTKKRGKESGGQLTKKKNLNKSHWWKLMQLHRGGKLTSKSQVKLGLAKKKARLKALPTIKCD